MIYMIYMMFRFSYNISISVALVSLLFSVRDIPYNFAIESSLFIYSNSQYFICNFICREFQYRSNQIRKDSILNLFLIFLVENYRLGILSIAKNEFHREWFASISGGKKQESRSKIYLPGIATLEEVAQFSFPQTARKYLTSNLSGSILGR